MTTTKNSKTASKATNATSTIKPPCEPGEEWRPCPGFPVYLISSHGRIWSLSRKRLHAIQQHNWINHGYQFVSLWNSEQKRNRTKALAPLVAEAFIGPRPEGKQVDHKDCVRSNNYATNLRYIPQYENIKRSYTLRNRKRGVRRDLDPVQHYAIRTLWGAGFHQTEIAELIGCDNSTVSKIVNNKIGIRAHLQDRTVMKDLNARIKLPKQT